MFCIAQEVIAAKYIFYSKFCFNTLLDYWNIINNKKANVTYNKFILNINILYKEDKKRTAAIVAQRSLNFIFGFKEAKFCLMIL